MKSSTTNLSLPSKRRKPRPSCCKNKTFDSVGRNIRTVSIEGKSTPSLNKSTEKMTCKRPLESCKSASPRLMAEPE